MLGIALHLILINTLHCVKSVQIWSYFRSLFYCIRIDYGTLNVRIQSECRNVQTKNNSVFGHFPRSAYYLITRLSKSLQKILFCNQLLKLRFKIRKNKISTFQLKINWNGFGLKNQKKKIFLQKLPITKRTFFLGNFKNRNSMQEIRKVLYTVFFIKLEKPHFGSNLGRFWPQNLK